MVKLEVFILIRIFNSGLKYIRIDIYKNKSRSR